MSAGEEWANDSDSRGRGCWLALPAAVLVALVLALAGCRTGTTSPPAPVTGVQPQPPVTAVVPSAVQVKP